MLNVAQHIFSSVMKSGIALRAGNSTEYHFSKLILMFSVS